MKTLYLWERMNRDKEWVVARNLCYDLHESLTRARWACEYHNANPDIIVHLQAAFELASDALTKYEVAHGYLITYGKEVEK